MTADQLRRLAVLIERTDHDAIDRAAGYLRACADAMEKGPVAWMHDDPARKDVIHEEVRDLLAQVDAHYHRPLDRTARYTIPLYPVALPPALRLPEPMTDAEIMELYRAVPKGYLSRDGHAGIRLARAIEAETLRRVKEANK